LVIHGAKSDILLQDTIDKMKNTKDFDLYTVHEAGHAPALFAPEQIDAIQKWLNKLIIG
jgi:pimeloyl-ACP methyl ester carboxylesterase